MDINVNTSLIFSDVNPNVRVLCDTFNNSHTISLPDNEKSLENILKKVSFPVFLNISGKHYEGIGMRNNNGGIEFFNYELSRDLVISFKKQYTTCLLKEEKEKQKLMKISRREARKKKDESSFPGLLDERKPFKPFIPTVTLYHPGITTVRKMKSVRSSSCCAFTNMMDYLGYLRFIEPELRRGIPHCEDCIILNNIQNFSNFLLESEEYEQIYCFFPHDDIARTMYMTMVTRNRTRVKDYSSVFGDSYSFYDYYQLKDQAS